MPSLLLCNYNILTPDSDEVLLRTEQLHQRHLDQYQLKIFPDLDTKNMFIWFDELYWKFRSDPYLIIEMILKHVFFLEPMLAIP